MILVRLTGNYLRIFHLQKGKSGVSTFLTAGGQSEELGQMSVKLEAFGLRANDFIVDVGCGYGINLNQIIKGDIWVRMLFLNS